MPVKDRIGRALYICRMGAISERDSRIVWHPYTPMKLNPTAIAIVKGEGAWLEDEDGNRYLDAISSWWVNIHGHSHPHIARKIAEQAATLEHSIFAGFTHEPAVQLAERLLEILPDSMSRIFYSDNGSTAVEVALKMAMQFWRNKGQHKQKIVAIAGAYHGDTFGAMAVSERSVFTAAFSEYLFDVSFIPFPEKGREQESLDALQQLVQQGDVAAFIAEPLIQGSAGMYMYSEAVLGEYFGICRESDTLIIADEVMTGFGRTGPLFACGQLATQPDIMCLSKGLTGGTMALGVTAANERVYTAFLDDDRTKTLYHGHSFTANPIACAAALASMDLVLEPVCEANRQRIIAQHAAFAVSIAGHPALADIRQTGTIIALELKVKDGGYHSNMRDKLYQFFLSRGLLMRPLGNIIYLLPPYCITNEELRMAYDGITALLYEIQEGRFLRVEEANDTAR